MPNIEREIAEEILGRQRASRLGLRFDRVVVGVLGALRAYAEATAPEGVALIVTLSAPIRSPAKTTVELKREMAAMMEREGPPGDSRLDLESNAVRLRLVSPSRRDRRFIGFVHNAESQPAPLMDLAEQWLRAET